jgi:hypothetical protein
MREGGLFTYSRDDSASARTDPVDPMLGVEVTGNDGGSKGSSGVERAASPGCKGQRLNTRAGQEG